MSLLCRSSRVRCTACGASRTVGDEGLSLAGTAGGGTMRCTAEIAALIARLGAETPYRTAVSVAESALGVRMSAATAWEVTDSAGRAAAGRARKAADAAAEPERTAEPERAAEPEKAAEPERAAELERAEGPDFIHERLDALRCSPDRERIISGALEGKVQGVPEKGFTGPGLTVMVAEYDGTGVPGLARELEARPAGARTEGRKPLR